MMPHYEETRSFINTQQLIIIALQEPTTPYSDIRVNDVPLIFSSLSIKGRVKKMFLLSWLKVSSHSDNSH